MSSILYIKIGNKKSGDPKKFAKEFSFIDDSEKSKVRETFEVDNEKRLYSTKENIKHITFELDDRGEVKEIKKKNARIIIGTDQHGYVVHFDRTGEGKEAVPCFWCSQNAHNMLSPVVPDGHFYPKLRALDSHSSSSL